MTAELVWERLPSGEFAWLRPSTDAHEDDDALFVVTEAGKDAARRQSAMAALFGPCPTVLDAISCPTRLAAA